MIDKLKKATDAIVYVKKAEGGKIILYTASALCLVVGTGLAVYAKWG